MMELINNWIVSLSLVHAQGEWWCVERKHVWQLFFLLRLQNESLRSLDDEHDDDDMNY